MSDARNAITPRFGDIETIQEGRFN